MFEFAYPTNLILLCTPVIVVLLFWWARTKRNTDIRRYGNPHVLRHLMPDASIYKPRIKIALEVAALIALVIVLARPRFGELQSQKSRVNGIEIMIAFDLSNSMLASSTDAEDGVSRLDRARLLLEQMLGRLDNDRVGLVIFAEEAKVMMPLTPDHYSAKMYLNELSPALMQMQGTSITDAINLASNSFSPDDSAGKAIILITDAEDHEGDAVKAAAEARKHGIQVDVVGVGTPKGGQIPMDRSGNNFLTDNEGNVVITKFDEKSAAQIAKAGGGVYVNGASSKALDTLTEALDGLDKGEFSRVEYKPGAEQFPLFTWLALILLLADVFVLDRKIGWLKNINFFSKDKSAKANADAQQPQTQKK